MKSHHKLLLALILGATLGSFFHNYSDSEWLLNLNRYVFEPLGQVFLRLIFMIVVPMVFSGLVLGTFELGKHQGLGRVIKRTLFFTALSSISSVIIGIFLVSLIKPGKFINLSNYNFSADNVDKIKSNVASSKPIIQALLEIIPKNPIGSALNALEGEMLSLMFFAMFFGFALSRGLKNSNKDSIFVSVLEEFYSASMVIVEYAMKLAPLAVFSLVFNSTSKFGYELLISLAVYVLVVVLALLIQQFGVYTILLKLFTKLSPLDFFKKCKDVYVYAFATASSNATLPKSLELAETKLNLTPSVSRFVLTVGSTANQNGTALFEGITVLFLAQVHGIDLSLASQLQVVAMSIIAGIGTAGVPGGSLPLIMILLQQVGIPPESIGIVFGVDRFLDMARTTLNVSGDLVIAALVDDKQSS